MKTITAKTGSGKSVLTVKRIDPNTWEVTCPEGIINIKGNDIKPIMKWAKDQILYAIQTGDQCTLRFTFDPDGPSYSLFETTLDIGEEIGVVIDPVKIFAEWQDSIIIDNIST